jgi:hypothetical protein
MDTKVKAFLDTLPAPMRREVDRLRRAILGAVSGLDEALKWGNPTYLSGKEKICFIYVYPNKDHVSLGFFQATSLDDPKGLFEGTGKGMRHVKVRTRATVGDAQIKKWVRQAVKLGAA